MYKHRGHTYTHLLPADAYTVAATCSCVCVHSGIKHTHSIYLWPLVLTHKCIHTHT